jgi:molybdate transport repressor ModE-like protein
MKIAFALRWLVDGVEVDARLLPLLRAIAEHGSLNQAIGTVGLSYRHAWGLLANLENALGQPLVTLERGRGARLTPLARRLLASEEALASEMAPRLSEQAEALSREVFSLESAAANRVVVHASHDLALAHLRDMLAESGACQVDLHFQGSLDALAALAHGQCDFAGFHIPDLPGRRLLLAQYQPWLKGRTLRVIHFVTRQQGLITARGNPLMLASLSDVAATHARFINRQPGSGTRITFDHLLAADGLTPAGINGYQREEFTHAAVAATIASGMADVAFGIEAAARQHGLDFVPLVSERYFLAMRSATLKRPGARALLDAAQNSAFLEFLHSLPGYSAVAPLQPVSATAILEPERV